MLQIQIEIKQPQHHSGGNHHSQAVHIVSFNHIHQLVAQRQVDFQHQRREYQAAQILELQLVLDFHHLQIQIQNRHSVI